MIIWPQQQGIYVVVFSIVDHRVITVGKLGKMNLCPGSYYYCGSAKGSGGLQKRIPRHLDRERKKFWHIDFLKIFARPIQVWYMPTAEVAECELVQAIKALPEITMPINGFGSSDCQSQCGSHLAFSLPDVNVNEVFRKMKSIFSGLQQAILFPPDEVR
jgi:Uri superfamily endonuclease